MPEINPPAELLNEHGKPDFKKLLQFVADNVRAKQAAGTSGGSSAQRLTGIFDELDALALLGDPVFFQQACWQEVAPTLTGDLYQHMFKRGVDASGLTFFSPRIAQDKSLLPSLQAMAASDEYRMRNAQPRTTGNGISAMIDQATRIAARYGKRNLTLAELVALLGPEMHLGEVHRRLWNIQPVDWSRKKVLLFGAFGNGNMGDAYQAVAMRQHVHRHMGVPLERIFACSVLEHADYPFPQTHKLLPSNVLNTDILNNFGMMLIGGGGLLAHPHEPLLSAEWVARLTLPVILVGVGASSGLAERFRPLANVALAASGRDAWSLKAFQAVGVTADLVPDAIASIGNPADLMAFDPPSPASENESFDWLWVIKHASNFDEQALLNQIRRLIDERADQRHCVIAIEPAMDVVLKAQFPEVRFVSVLNELWPLIEGSQRVCSMRFHGGIFALLQDKPVVGCAQSKLKMLTDEWGGGLLYADSANDLGATLQRCPPRLDRPGLDHASLQEKMASFLQRFEK